MVIFFIILFVILLWGIGFSGIHGWNEEYLSNKSGKGIKGFVALLVVLQHLTLQIDNPGVLAYLINAGVLCVGMFFFYSGYGLIKSLNTKDNYLNGFLKHRLSVVLIPFFVTNLIYVITYTVTKQFYVQNLSPLEKVYAVFGILLLNGNAWYIVAIAIFYIVFYLLFRFIKNRKICYIGMFLFLCVYITICVLSKHGYAWFQGEWWYNTAMVFLFGMLYGNFEKAWLSFFKKRYWAVLPISIAGFCLLFHQTNDILKHYSYWSASVDQSAIGYKECFICLCWQIPTVFVFVWMCILLFMKFKTANKILSFLGSISLELYLIHGLFIFTFHSDVIYIKNSMLYIVCVYLCSIVSAFVVWKGIGLCKGVRTRN